MQQKLCCYLKKNLKTYQTYNKNILIYSGPNLECIIEPLHVYSCQVMWWYWLIVSVQASLSMAPVNIFKHGADEEKAETARLVGLFSVFGLNYWRKINSWNFIWLCFCFVFSICVFSLQSSFVGAIAIGDLVKSTLGPKGMVGHVNLPSWLLFKFYSCH